MQHHYHEKPNSAKNPCVGGVLTREQAASMDVRLLRVMSMQLLTKKPPQSVMDGGVVAAREFKDRCFVLRRFSRGAPPSAALFDAVASLMAQHAGRDASGARHGLRAAPGPLTLPDGNHGETFDLGVNHD